MTFPPYRLSTSITREGTRFITLKISRRERRERQNKAAWEEGGRGALTAISSSSELSFSWMAVNPPCSPNWGEKKQTNTKGEETRDDEDDGFRGPAGRRLNYSLDSPNPPANRAAPERGNAGG